MHDVIQKTKTWGIY